MLSFYILTHYPLKEALQLLKYVQGLYYFMIFFGGFLSWILIYRRLLAMDYDRIRVHFFMFFAGGAGILSVVIGSRIVRIFYEPVDTWSLSLFWQKFWGGGLLERGTETFHGSLFILFGVMVAILIGSNLIGFLKFDYAEIIDMGAVYFPLHILFGRTGCFLAGCCWGFEGQITICGDTYAFNHPAPFYEMMYGLIAFFVFRFIYSKIYASEKRDIYSGLLTAVAALSYGVLRFLIEYIRKEPVVGFGFTHAQFAMIIQMTFGLGVLAWVSGKVYLYRKSFSSKQVKRKRKKKR